MTYGERVKFARLKLGVSIAEFAVLLGANEGTVENAECSKDGSYKLGFNKMKKIIELANLPAGWFFYNDNEIDLYVNKGIITP